MVRAAAIICLLLAACDGEPGQPVDAGPLDRPPPTEGLPSIAEGGGHHVIDFVVQGCFERTADHCGGPVPLTLIFSAVLQEEAERLSWDFGDGSPPQSGLVVSHTYLAQGSFTVSLGATALSGPPLLEQKPGFVQVSAGKPGAPCSSDASCAAGSCVCRETCTFPLSEGLCLQPCDKAGCYVAGTTCIDLSVPGQSNPPVWRTRLCLPTCTTEKECRPGFLCRQAPTAGGWVNACLPPFPRSVGEPCRDPGGAPDPSLCLGGLCLDIGASGYCSAACASAACPEGARCARLGGGPVVCLARCGGGSCAADPRLGCQAPDSAGQYGFEIFGPPDPTGTTYCAPKRCLLDGECGQLGRCDLGKGGFCVPL